MTDRELMQQALDSLEYCAPHQALKTPYFVIEALRARLAQPEPEPVAQIQIAEDYYAHAVLLGTVDPMYLDQAYLYLAPPQREWQGLTDEEVQTAYCSICDTEWAIGGMGDAEPFARAIEARLKGKNE